MKDDINSIQLTALEMHLIMVALNAYEGAEVLHDKLVEEGFSRFEPTKSAELSYS